MKNKELAEKMSRNFGKVKLSLMKHSPEILIGAGVVGVVTSAVLACKATTKLDSIMSKAKKRYRNYQRSFRTSGKFAGKIYKRR